MQIPGLLIEYLINGSVALIWLLPLIISTNVIPDKIDNSTLAVVILVPALYVLGMVIDTVANFIVSPHKARIRERMYQKNGISEAEFQKMDGYLIEAKLILYAPELAKAVEKRSTRDRIARSSIVNVILAMIILIVYGFSQKNNWLIPVLYLTGGVVVILFCWMMWARYQAGSFAYGITAFQALEKKLEHEQASEVGHKSIHK